MRTKSSKTPYFDFSGESSIKVVKEYRAKYEAISQILDANRQVLGLAHRDWAKLLSTSAKGRDGWTNMGTVGLLKKSPYCFSITVLSN